MSTRPLLSLIMPTVGDLTVGELETNRRGEMKGPRSNVQMYQMIRKDTSFAYLFCTAGCVPLSLA